MAHPWPHSEVPERERETGDARTGVTGKKQAVK